MEYVLNFPSMLYIPVPTGEGNTTYSVCARGSLIREPKVGYTVPMYELPGDIRLTLEMDMVEEDLNDKYLFVRLKPVDIAILPPDVSPLALAEGISDFLTSAGWQPCDDSGRYLDAA
jgi:hypothetical protein